MLRLMIALFKIALASLIAGAILSFFGVTMQTVLALTGLTPEMLWSHIQTGIAWAVPNIVLGSLIVVPVWLFTYIFLPPRD